MCVLYQKYCKYTIRICDWLRVSRGFALQDQSLSGYSISKKTNKKKNNIALVQSHSLRKNTMYPKKKEADSIIGCYQAAGAIPED